MTNNLAGILWAELDAEGTAFLLYQAGTLYDNHQGHHATMINNCSLASVSDYVGRRLKVRTVANCWNHQIQVVRLALPEEARAFFRLQVYPHIVVSQKHGVNAGLAIDMFKGEHYVLEQKFELELTLAFVEKPF